MTTPNTIIADLAAEVEALRQQLAECQAALALKDEALQVFAKLYFEEAITALASKPDPAALREWGARLLEAYQNEENHYPDQSAERLRSGEWTPEILK